MNYLQDAFLINKAERYDIKGKKYITTPSKYYFTDIGLRNARLNFRQQEEDYLMENIIYNRSDISEEDVYNVCKTVGLDHFIRTLPNGYNSKITDGDGISAGQKQLLTIARGMLDNAPFLILDEATSNVDTRTEELVSKAMDKLTEGKTSFIIAHRLSTIKNADLILVMKDGNIIEQGNHDELMSQNGFYAELYNSQFEL